MVKWWSPTLWGAHLLAVVAFAAPAALGYWQYDVWHDHRIAEQHDLTGAPPVPLDEVMGHDEAFPGDGVGQPVELRGSWLTGATVLVEDRRDDAGHRGRWVVTPLTVGGPDAPAIPVVRGWVPESTGPSGVPKPPSPTADVTGWLQPPEGQGAADDNPSDAILPSLQVSAFAQRVKQDLYGGFVVAKHPDAGLAPATLSQLPAVGAGTSLRNILYAFEWWFFAAFVVFMWWRHVRDATTERPVGDASADGVTDDPVASGS
ncbi:SURF1 family protein [Nocardioides montaniterrae]